VVEQFHMDECDGALDTIMLSNFRKLGCPFLRIVSAQRHQMRLFPNQGLPQLYGRLVGKGHFADPKLEGAESAADGAEADDQEYEDAGDNDAVRTLDDVVDQRERKNAGDQPEVKAQAGGPGPIGKFRPFCCASRHSAKATATSAESIRTRTPVAYAPPCASTLASKTRVTITSIANSSNTSGRL